MALKSPRRGVQSIRRHHSAALGSFPSRAFYVDATLGNDANSGTYPDEAWQTIPKVNGETLFNIDFETNDLTQFDAVVDPDADLSVTGAAAMAGTSYGLSVIVDDQIETYGTKNFCLSGKTDFRVRCYIDINTLTMGDTNIIVFLLARGTAPDGDLLKILIRYDIGPGYRIAFRAYRDNGTNIQSNFYAISDDPHYVEAHVVRSTGAGDNNGTAELWVDGVSQEVIAGVDNYDILPATNKVRIGAMSVGAGVADTFYLDELYVNSTGDAIGTTTGQPSAEVYVPGDRILFKRGETFIGTLYPSSSGMASRHIVYGAYGSGALPIIYNPENEALFHNRKNYIHYQDLDLREDVSGAQNVVTFTTTQNIGNRFSRCVISGGKQVWLSEETSDTLLHSCTISNTSHEGVIFKGPNNIIENCVVHDCCLETADRAGIKFNQSDATGNIARNCTVYNMDVADDNVGIEVDVVGPGANCIIVNCNVYACAIGVYIYGSSDCAIINNLVHDLTFFADFSGAGIMFDSSPTPFGVANCDIYHNTVYSVTQAIDADELANSRIKNNIFVEGTTRLITVIGGNEATNDFDNNIYVNAVAATQKWYWIATLYTDDWAGFRAASSQEANGLNADPVMVNPGAGDFHLQVGSPCRGAGAIGTGVTDDYDGVARPDPPTQPDIGAYQFVP